ACLVIVPARTQAQQPNPAADFFERNVRPVLVERCLSCHGPEKAKSGLRLDTREAMLTGGDGGPVVVPGKPKDSRLVAAVRQSGELKMPPSGKLPDREIAALEKWVELGAPWPERVRLGPPDAIEKAAATHWAFKPVRRPAVPVGDRNPIDHFVIARLSAANLKPNSPADRRTLIRRASFDLHGLPPTPDEVEAFVNDPDPEAYPKLLDRLLVSPRYGERWGRHWLDVARYARNNE